MFERFTRSARSVVIDARQVASEGGAREIRNDHLMVAVLRRRGGAGARVLAAAGLGDGDRAALLDEFGAVNRRAGIGVGDADALREIGIDVDEMLGRMDELAAEPEETTQQPPASPMGALRRRVAHALNRDDGGEISAGGVRFSTDGKRTLERTPREALDLRDRHIDEAHILLALVARPGVVAETLQRYGITYADVRRALPARADAG